jgi:hypothetical protein
MATMTYILRSEVRQKQISCMTMLLAAHSIPCRSFSIPLGLLNFCHLAFSRIFLVALLVSRFLLQHGHFATPFHCLGISQLEFHALVEIHFAIGLNIPVCAHSNDILARSLPVSMRHSYVVRWPSTLWPSCAHTDIATVYVADLGAHRTCSHPLSLARLKLCASVVLRNMDVPALPNIVSSAQSAQPNW